MKGIGRSEWVTTNWSRPRGDPWELYNLATDRAEANNLADKMPAKVKELATQWEQQLAAMSNQVRQEQGPPSEKGKKNARKAKAIKENARPRKTKQGKTVKQ